MHRIVDFYFDLLSPYAYLCFCRLPGVIKRSGGAVLLHPVSLPRLLELSGNPPPISIPAKAAYIRSDTVALARYYGIPFQWPSVHPQKTGRAMSVLTMLDESERVAMTQKLFEAIWIEGMDLGDTQVLDSLVGQTLLEAAAADDVRAQLMATTQTLLDRGGFGVPSLMVGEQLLFGNDRLFLVERALNQ